MWLEENLLAFLHYASMSTIQSKSSFSQVEVSIQSCRQKDSSQCSLLAGMWEAKGIKTVRVFPSLKEEFLWWQTGIMQELDVEFFFLDCFQQIKIMYIQSRLFFDVFWFFNWNRRLYCYSSCHFLAFYSIGIDILK